MSGRQSLTAAARPFDIPAQPLTTALTRFAEQAGVFLSYDSALAAGVTSRPVHGRYIPDEALALLLDGSGLKPEISAEGTVTLVRAARDPLRELVENAGRPMRLAEAEPEQPKPAKRDEDTTGALPEMTITASPFDETSYTVPNASTATKTDTPIMETPYSIKVVPQQVLQDQRCSGWRRLFKT